MLGRSGKTSVKFQQEEEEVDQKRSWGWDFWGGLRANPAGPLENEVASALAVAGRSRTAEMVKEKVMNPVMAEDGPGRSENAGNGQTEGGWDVNAQRVGLRRRWVEESDNTRREYTFRGSESDSGIKTLQLKDTRAPLQKLGDSFLSRFFPLGYPDSVDNCFFTSVSEGYLVYSQYRAVQHFASAILSVLSTQSLLFAAGLRPTPAQATIVSWVLKDGMQHIGKFVCSSMGTQMDSDPKRWRIFADAIYDVGAGLEVISPMCPQHFLTVAGLANMAKGMALVSARATRLPVYSSFAREGNLSDLYAKGEAISTLSNVFGLGIGIRLALTVCSTTRGKLLVSPWLSAVHLYSVVQEMRAAPINTLNSQRTALLVADFIKTGIVSRPAALRYRERLILPVGPNQESGNVRVGRSLVRVLSKPSVLAQLKSKFPQERFLLHFSDKATDLVLHQSATGEDALRGWLVAAYAHKLACQHDHQNREPYGEQGFGLRKASALQDAYEQTEKVLQTFLVGLKEQGWHTHMFLEGSGYRAVW